MTEAISEFKHRNVSRSPRPMGLAKTVWGYSFGVIDVY